MRRCARRNAARSRTSAITNGAPQLARQGGCRRTSISDGSSKSRLRDHCDVEIANDPELLGCGQRRSRDETIDRVDRHSGRSGYLLEDHVPATERDAANPVLIRQASSPINRARGTAIRACQTCPSASARDARGARRQPTASPRPPQPAPAVARTRQCLGKFRFQHRLNEPAPPSSDPVLDPVEPIIEKQTLGGDSRLLRGILCHGVVSVPARQRRNHFGLNNPETTPTQFQPPPRRDLPRLCRGGE